MSTSPSHVSGRPARTNLIHATKTGRRCIATALKARDATPSELRTFLYATVELVSWSRTGDTMPTAQVSAATRLHPHTVGRNLRAWHDRGVWNYSPARRAGVCGTVSFNDVPDIELGFTPTDQRDAMAVIWPTMRRAAQRTCRGPVAAVRVVLAVLGGAACWSRLEVSVSHKELADAAGCTVAQVRRALSWLVENDVIAYTPGTGHSPSKIRLIAADPVSIPEPSLTREATEPETARSEHPGCAPDDRPIHDRDNADTSLPQLAPVEPEPSSGETPSGDERTSQVARELERRTGLKIALESPAGARLHTEVTLRPGWCVEELVESLLQADLPKTALAPTGLFAYRASLLPVESPREQASQQASKLREKRRQAELVELEHQQAQNAADRAANVALEPHLARVDALPPADRDELAKQLPAWLKARYRTERPTALMRTALAELLAARDGIDLELVAETARRRALTHETGTIPRA